MKNYYVADNGVVSDEDITEAIKIANETNEIIKLIWSGAGWQWYPTEINAYWLVIKPGSKLEELKQHLPKTYAI